MSSTWETRPTQPHHRIHIGRFKRPVLLLFAAEALVLGLSIALNEMAYFVVGAAAALGVYFVWVRTRRARDFRTNLEAVRLLAAGELDASIELLDGLCRHPNNGSTLAVFLMNRGTASLCKGEFELALQIYHEVLRAERGVARSVFKVRGDVFRSRCADALAVYGELEAAEAMLAGQKNNPPQAREGLELLARAVIALRRKKPEAALDHLATHWASAEGLYTTTELKALMLVRAFAAGQDNLVGSSVTAHDLERNRWLGAHWPEMARFLDGFETADASSHPNKRHNSE